MRVPPASAVGLMPSSDMIAGIILASGLSRRFVSANKLLLPVDGEPLVRRVTSAFLQAEVSPVFVVVGHEAAAVREALADLPIDFVDNPEYQAGQSRALNRGVSALPPEAGAAVIGVADQPCLSPDIIARLTERFRTGPTTIVAPRYAGQRGNPVLFAASLFPELRAIEGDQGGRAVLAAHPDEIAWVDFPDSRPGLDVDTLDEYRRLQEEKP